LKAHDGNVAIVGLNRSLATATSAIRENEVAAVAHSAHRF